MGRCLVVHLSARSGLQQTLQQNENRARSATRPPCTAWHAKWAARLVGTCREQVW